MARTFISEGNAAFVDEDYETALSFYSKAIDADGENAEAYALRSHAQIKLENFIEAAEDADKAVQLDPGATKAYLRKGIACFSMEEFETAKHAFEEVVSLEPSNSQAKSWLNKCIAKLQEEQGGISGEVIQVDNTPQDGQHSTANGVAAATNQDDRAIAPCATPVQNDKYRLEWFQTQNKVEVAVLAKKLTPDRLTVSIEPKQLLIVIRDQEGDEEYRKDIRLFATVDEAKSKFELLSTKVEIKLAKKETSSWLTLEEGAQAKARVVIHDPNRLVQPHYPSSSRRKVDWDEVDNELKKEEKGEKLEGDAALQKLFQDIYSNADEETRRAMNKSFVESNGTVLSTNWKEVGSKQVDVQAPSGTDPKPY